MHQRCYIDELVSLRVESEDAASLAWLDEILPPWLEVAADTAPRPTDSDVRVRFTRDTRRFEDLAEHLRRAPERAPLPCFALDTEVLAFPGLAHEDRALLVDEKRACALTFDADGVEVVTREEAGTSRLVLMRAVREIVSEAHRRAPRRVQLHAAAFELDGATFLIAGAKNAGKTTLLTHALVSRGARYVTNDRVIVIGDGRGARALGMPTAVSVRPGTLRRFPQLLEHIPAGAHTSQLTRAELRAACEGQPPRDATTRLRLSAAHLCERLAVEPSVGGPVGAVLLPEIDAHARGTTFEATPHDTARARLDRCLYGGATHRTTPTVFERYLAPVGTPNHPEPARLLHAVPVLRCRLGPDAYDAPFPSLDGVCSSPA